MGERKESLSHGAMQQNYNAGEVRIGSFKVIDDGPAMLRCSAFVLHKVFKINRG